MKLISVGFLEYKRYKSFKYILNILKYNKLNPIIKPMASTMKGPKVLGWEIFSVDNIFL